MPLITRYPELHPTHIRIGRFLLALTCIALLSGRFTLDRLSPGLPEVDLRWFLALTLAILSFWWGAVTSASVPQEMQHKTPRNGMIWFILWILWMAFTSLWAPTQARILSNLEDLFFLGFFVLLAWWLLSRLPPEAAQRMFAWLLFVGFAYFVLSMIQGAGVQGRFSAPGGGPNVFARIMVFAAIAALFYLIVNRKRLLAVGLISLFSIGAVLSGSRGALLAAAVALLLTSIPLVRRFGFWRLILSVAFIVGIGIAAINLLNVNIQDFIEERYVEQTLEIGNSAGRDEITADALAMFTSSPIWGVGLDGYYALQTNFDLYAYPHNLLLAVAAEGGLIGVVLLACAWGSLLRSATRNQPIPLVSFIGLIAFLFASVASFTSGDYYDSRYIWFFGAFASVTARTIPPTVLDSRNRRLRGKKSTRTQRLIR